MARPTLAFLLAFAFGLAPATGLAQTHIALDGGSYFAIPSLDISAPIPEGNIPVQIAPLGGKRWAVSSSAAELQIAEQTLPNGDMMNIIVTQDPVGECTVKGKKADCSFQLDLLVRAGTSKPRPIRLDFSTGPVSKRTGGKSVSSTGSAIDTRTGAVRLVAAAETPPEWALKSGQPVLVVFSGTLEGSPF